MDWMRIWEYHKDTVDSLLFGYGMILAVCASFGLFMVLTIYALKLAGGG